MSSVQKVRELAESLKSSECPACKRAKAPRNSFCRFCYLELPKDMQQAMYKRFGEGYEQAWDAAMSHLTGENNAQEQGLPEVDQDQDQAAPEPEDGSRLSEGPVPEPF